MDIKLLKKWRAKANELFFKDMSVGFHKQLQFNIPEFCSWKDYDGHIKCRQGIGWISFYEDECIQTNDLKSKLRKSYKTFVNNYLEYMIYKTKEKYPYKSFKIKCFKVKRR